jgi:glucose/arabinose dehydrogenase
MRRAAVAMLALLAAGCAGSGSAGTSSGAAPAPSLAPSTAQPPTSTGGGRPGPVVLRKVVADLDQPVDLAFLPDGSMAVAEKPGRVVIVRGGVVRSTMLDISGSVSTSSEQGLLGIAFVPGSHGRRLVVSFTDRDGDSNIYLLDVRDGRAGLAGARRLLFLRQPYPNHNGGDVAFGPDGRLYAGFGDGGSEGDPDTTSQDPSTLLGKIVRLNLSGGAPQMVALGARNPWRFSFDTATGDLWIGDVGQDRWEEIDRIPAGTAPVVNLGWSMWEGSHRFKRQPSGGGRPIFPVAEYPHTLGCSVVGGFVAHGPAAASLDGRYVYGDFCSGRLWSMQPGGRPSQLAVQVPQLSSFAQDAAGGLYALSLNGSMYRLVTAS